MVTPNDEDSDFDESGEVAVEEQVPALGEPPRFAVILHNDDYTTMEFVTEVLQRFFHKSREEAVTIMLSVHEKGRGIAGIYTHEIAETKAAQVVQLAQTRGFPLLCTIEEQ